MNLKYQIFVSSTYEDLRDERNEVIKACLNMGNIPVGMEMFNAADEEQWQVITRTIDQCDYYVVIVAHRYGSITPEGVSFTEKEYDYAIERGIPVLGFVIADDARWPGDRMQNDPEARAALDRFKSKVKQKMVRFWQTASELRSQFVESLATTINVNPRRGWVRAPEATDVDIAQTLSNLSEENARLRKALDSLQSTGARSGEAETIVAALAKFKIRRQLEDGTETTMDGTETFLHLATAPGRPIDQTLPGLDRHGTKQFMAAIARMGLIETVRRSSGHQHKLTPRGGVVYARLIAEPEVSSVDR